MKKALLIAGLLGFGVGCISTGYRPVALYRFGDKVVTFHTKQWDRMACWKYAKELNKQSWESGHTGGFRCLLVR